MLGALRPISAARSRIEVASYPSRQKQAIAASSAAASSNARGLAILAAFRSGSSHGFVAAAIENYNVRYRTSAAGRVEVPNGDRRPGLRRQPEQPVAARSGDQQRIDPEAAAIMV